MKKVLHHCLLIFCIGCLPASPALADELRIAVASNFTNTIKHLAAQFEQQSGHSITLIFGSTGKHYAQIKNGAPFDLFFAADARRPRLLDQEGIAVNGSRFTYAIGKLVLWSPQPGLVDPEGKVLSQQSFHHLAAANPKLAPYGKAAQQVLQQKKLWSELRGKIVRGENIGQTYQFVKSGNAELGFVAYSQIKSPDQVTEGSLWNIPQSLYTPIKQQVVALKESPAALAFLSFVKSSEGQTIIRSFGYGTT
ncbi:MAG: molybdate ABC transporter substrate-binding protein [Chromatiales bacterium]|nr:molybdate ABC transporter substrate-binding protein [Chromatiales bacterium]